MLCRDECVERPHTYAAIGMFTRGLEAARRPRVTGEIAARFPISRIAVMRHLDVLSEAGLAVSHKRGRQRWHYLNIVPLQKLHRRGANPGAPGFASARRRREDTDEAESRHPGPLHPALDRAQGIETAHTPAA